MSELVTSVRPHFEKWTKLNEQRNRAGLTFALSSVALLAISAALTYGYVSSRSLTWSTAKHIDKIMVFTTTVPYLALTYLTFGLYATNVRPLAQQREKALEDAGKLVNNCDGDDAKKLEKAFGKVFVGLTHPPEL